MNLTFGFGVMVAAMLTLLLSIGYLLLGGWRGTIVVVIIMTCLLAGLALSVWLIIRFELLPR